MTENELRGIVQTNIKRFRGYRKLTQAELAEKVNISINFLSDIENGKKWISPATMVKFADVLNIEPYELFKRPESPPPSVSTLFARYNKEIADALPALLKEIYGYYQARLEGAP